MSKEELLRRLQECSDMMIELGVDMEYFGGLSDIAAHGKQLTGAGQIMKSWIKGIEDM